MNVIGYKERGNYAVWIIKESIYYNAVLSVYPFKKIIDGSYGHTVLSRADKAADELLDTYAGKRANVSNR